MRQLVPHVDHACDRAYIKASSGWLVDVTICFDLAVLEVLTQFVSWAGRYPDPSSKFIAKRELIFELSETQSITARDIFDVAARVMSHLRLMTGSADET